MQDYVQRLKELLEERGVSLKALAAGIGVPYRTLQDNLSKNKGLSVENLAKTCTFLNVSMDELLGSPVNHQELKSTQYVFGDIIKRLMKLKAYSYEQDLAEVLGFSKTAFTERKRRNAVPMNQLVAFCEQERLNLNWVLTGEGEPQARKADAPGVMDPSVPWQGSRHPDPEIQAVIEMMEGMDKDTKQDIRLSVEKEKLLRELLKQKEDRAAG